MTPSKVMIKTGSVLIMDGSEIVVEDLEVDGACVIQKTGSAVVKGVNVRSQTFSFLKAIPF